MKTTHSAFFLLALIALTGCNMPWTKKLCLTQESCANDPNCQCWCSVECNYRDKKPNDNPTYVAKDPNGKFCYCKQWDRDHYKERCIDGKDIKEPADAK